MYLIIDSEKHNNFIHEYINKSDFLKMKIIDRQKNPKKVDKLFGKLPTPMILNLDLLNTVNFGDYSSERRGINIKPSGTKRMKGSNDFIPQQNWGGFSASPGNNRAGNSINCKESADWLYKNNSAPDFRFGKNKFGNQKDKLLSSVNANFYNHRGKTGFDKIPKGIYEYQGGPIPNYS
jgi:hypothetical protein